MIMVEVGAAHVPNAATPQEHQLELNDHHPPVQLYLSSFQISQ